MLVALDPLNLNRVISASLAVKGRQYFCPCCKEKVTVRSIGQYSKKQPYFAHLRGVADKGCENFVESLYISSFHFGSFQSKGLEEATFKDLSIAQSRIGTKSTKNLYLKVNENVWELYFSFQIYAANSKWDGRIIIHGQNGVRIFNSNTISSEQHFVLVNFDFNEVNIIKDGQVDNTICEFLLKNVPKINGEINIFHAPYSSGKLLKESDNIYIGETYIIALNQSYKMLSALDDLIQRKHKINNIDFYQIELTDAIGPDVKMSIESFLEKKIQPRRPLIRLLDPLPERIGFDSSIYVSKNTNKLVISYDCDKGVLDWIPMNGIKEYDDQYLNENTLIINVSKLNGINLYWKNSLIFRIIKAHTKSIDISGLTLINGVSRFNLIDSNVKKNNSINGEFTIDLDWLSDNKAFQIRENIGNSLFPIVKNKLYHFGHGLEIDAGAFGYYLFINSNKESCINNLQKELEVKKSPKEKWLNSIRLVYPVTVEHLNRNRIGELSYFSIITNSHYRTIHKINLNKAIK